MADLDERQKAVKALEIGINDIRGRVFGHLTLALTGEADAVQRAIDAVSAFAPLIEEDTRG